jgi:sodium/hydrogen antiporter
MRSALRSPRSRPRRRRAGAAFSRRSRRASPLPRSTSSSSTALSTTFLDYGEATAEMFLLLTFVAFGASLIWRGFDVLNMKTVLFAFLALSVRTLVLFPVLKKAGLDRMSLRVVAWFGPRGLSTLLLVLLPVFDGIPGAEEMFTICCLVVLLSVLLHGSAIGLIVRRPAGWVTTSFNVPVAAAPLPAMPDASAVVQAPARVAVAEPAPAAASTAAVAGDAAEGLDERITIDEMRDRQKAGEDVYLLDVRTGRTFEADAFIARGAIRMPPDDAVKLAKAHRIPWKATLVAYCA